MNIKDRETPEGLTYLPQVPDFDGFAEAVRALKISGVTGDTITVNAAITLIKDQELETAKDQARDTLLAQIAGQALSPEIKAELEKRIESAIGSATNIAAIRAIVSAMNAEIREAGDWSNTEKSLNDQQTREQQLNAIWDQLGKLNDDMSKTVHDFLTNDELKEEAKLQQAVAEAKTKEEKEAAQKALNLFYKDKGSELQNSEDPNAQQAGAKVQTQVQQAEDLLDKSYKIQMQGKETGTEEKYITKRTGSFAEDDEPVAVEQKQAPKSSNITSSQDMEIGNLVANIPPQPKAPGGGRGI